MPEWNYSLTGEIGTFLGDYGFECSVQVHNSFDILSIRRSGTEKSWNIIPIEITESYPDAATDKSEKVQECIKTLVTDCGDYPLIIPQDRWNRQNEMICKRILAHLELFSPIYARNCEIRRIDKTVARKFLEKTHSYGHAACRYCYGMFFKRHTGHIAKGISFADTQDDMNGITPGTLVAVATFSNARKWIKGERTVRSYEWTRYASLPEARIIGGMGRFLKHFVKEVQPDDIMTYADLEWSEGDVYMRLGFVQEEQKSPVMFTIGEDWQRFPIKPAMEDMQHRSVIASPTGNLYFRNLGSNKFRLKLTNYE